MPSRIGELAGLLDKAVAAGYRICSYSDLLAEQPPSPQKLLVLRIDVDTDPATAGLLARQVKSAGGSASVFFRLPTIDWHVIDQAARSGMHVSYHYEEPATLAKQRGVRTAGDYCALLPRAREDFARNLSMLRERTGLPMDIVCSHGDWINRFLGVDNTVLLADEPFRRSVGVVAEVYDASVRALIAADLSDRCLPHRWESGDPHQAVERQASPIALLIHPREWRASVRSNVFANLSRVVETVRWRLQRPTRVAC